MKPEIINLLINGLAEFSISSICLWIGIMLILSYLKMIKKPYVKHSWCTVFTEFIDWLLYALKYAIVGTLSLSLYMSALFFALDSELSFFEYVQPLLPIIMTSFIFFSLKIFWLYVNKQSKNICMEKYQIDTRNF